MGKSKLHRAAQLGDVRRVQKYVEEGLDVNTTDDSDYGNAATALHFAAGNGNAEMVSELLTLGAEINLTNKDGNTALHLAAMNGHQQTCRKLIEAGAEIDRGNSRDNTALHWAARTGKARVCSLLLQCGADFWARNTDGHTPLDRARSRSRQDVVELMRQWLRDHGDTDVPEACIGDKAATPPLQRSRTTPVKSKVAWCGVRESSSVSQGGGATGLQGPSQGGGAAGVQGTEGNFVREFFTALSYRGLVARTLNAASAWGDGGVVGSESSDAMRVLMRMTATIRTAVFLSQPFCDVVNRGQEASSTPREGGHRIRGQSDLLRAYERCLADMRRLAECQDRVTTEAFEANIGEIQNTWKAYDGRKKGSESQGLEVLFGRGLFSKHMDLKKAIGDRDAARCSFVTSVNELFRSICKTKDSKTPNLTAAVEAIDRDLDLLDRYLSASAGDQDHPADDSSLPAEDVCAGLFKSVSNSVAELMAWQQQSKAVVSGVLDPATESIAGRCREILESLARASADVAVESVNVDYGDGDGDGDGDVEDGKSGESGQAASPRAACDRGENLAEELKAAVAELSDRIGAESRAAARVVDALRVSFPYEALRRGCRSARALLVSIRSDTQLLADVVAQVSPMLQVEKKLCHEQEKAQLHAKCCCLLEEMDDLRGTRRELRTAKRDVEDAEEDGLGPEVVAEKRREYTLKMRECQRQQKVVDHLVAVITRAAEVQFPEYFVYVRHVWSSGVSSTASSSSLASGVSSHSANSAMIRLDYGSERTIDMYGIVSTLAEGVGKRIRLVEFDGGLAVLKSYSLSNENMVRAFRREASYLSRLNHPTIVKVEAAFLQHDRVGQRETIGHLHLAYYAGGNLTTWINKHNPGVSHMITVWREILRGLECIHSAGIVHCDIKSDNIFMDEAGMPHIGDFDVSKDTFGRTGTAVELTRSINTVAGTPAFMAPEVMQGKRPSCASDIYSFGLVVLGCIFRVENPKEHSLLCAQIRHDSEGAPVLPPLPAYVHDEAIVISNGSVELSCAEQLVSVLNSTLSLSPTARARASEALSLPIFCLPVSPSPRGAGGGRSPLQEDPRASGADAAIAAEEAAALNRLKEAELRERHLIVSSRSLRLDLSGQTEDESHINAMAERVGVNKAIREVRQELADLRSRVKQIQTRRKQMWRGQAMTHVPNFWVIRSLECKPRIVDVSDTFLELMQAMVLKSSQQPLGLGSDQRQDTGSYSRLTLVKVEHVENPYLYQTYCLQKVMMRRTAEQFDIRMGRLQADTEAFTDSLEALGVVVDQTVNEFLLFHGVPSRDTAALISQQGFDEHVGSLLGMLGSGIYFSEASSKSDQYCTSDADGCFTMLVGRVCMGNFYEANGPSAPVRGAQEITVADVDKLWRRPPSVPNQPIIYDSVLAGYNGLRYREFVVYNRAQTYPEFILTYKRE